MLWQQGWFISVTLKKQFSNFTAQDILSLSAVCVPNSLWTSHKYLPHPSQSFAAGPPARGGVRADAGRPALERHAAAVDGRAPQLPRQLPLPHRGGVVVGLTYNCVAFCFVNSLALKIQFCIYWINLWL